MAFILSMTQTTPFTQEIALFLVNALRLSIDATSLSENAVLFGQAGIGLDSIDALELAYAIHKAYGVQLKSGDPSNAEIFASLKNLADYIQTHRACSTT